MEIREWWYVLAAVLGVVALVGGLFAWRRLGVRPSQKARARELEALGEAGRAIVAAQLNITALCELITEEAGKVIDNSTFQIGLFEDTFYHIYIWVIDGVRQPERTFDLSQNKGLVGWIRESKQPLLVRDFPNEIEQLPARPVYISPTPPRSALFIPLISGDEVVGVLAAQHAQPHRFNYDDLRRLMIVSNQAAAAIANARLYEQERTRAAHLDLVGQIARQVNAIQDLEELFNQVVLLTRRTFGFHPVSVFGMDPLSGEAVIQASSAENIRPGLVRLAPGRGLIGTAVATRQTTLSNNTQKDRRFLAMLELPVEDPTTGTRSEMVVPLVVDDELLGVLDVHSPQVGAFRRAERIVLQALAAQTAIAIHKARQFAIQREQAWITIAQLQMAEALGRSADLEEVMTAVTRLTPLLVGVNQCAILLWDQEQAVYQGGAVYGGVEQAAGDFGQVQLALGDWKALDAVHVGHEKLVTQQWPRILRPFLSGGQMSLYPLMAKANLLGVMIVAEPENAPIPAAQLILTPPSTRREELLRNIAGQAAQAIENAQLHVAQQEEAWVNTALLQVAEAVNSLIDLNEILDTIVRLVPMLVGVDSCLVLFWEKDRQHFRAGPSYGLTEMGRGLLTTFEIDRSEFPNMAVDDSPAAPESVVYTVQLPTWLATVLGTNVAMALPLVARGSLVGALVVGPSANERPLSGRRLNILTGIAQQAAVAVVNDHLYQESAERSRMEQELTVARRIQASLLPAGAPPVPGCSVAGHWQAARQVSGDFYDYLALPKDQWGIAVADVADKGVPAAIFMTLSRTVLRAVAFNRSDPAGTLERVNDILLNDSQSDLFVTLFYAIWQPDTQTLLYANGGHNPPLLVHADGQCEWLTGKGIALGVLPDVQIEEKRARLTPGDVVLFYTDGVTEAMNEDYDEFGLERLQVAARGLREQDAAGIVAGITHAVRDHAGSTPQSDDITLVVLKRENTTSVMRDMDQLAAEIGAQWRGTPSAVDAVREQRREL